MKSISLRVDVSSASDISDVCKDASDLANKLEIGIWFSFNGVECYIAPNQNPQNLAKNYFEANKNNRNSDKSKFANAY